VFFDHTLSIISKYIFTEIFFPKSPFFPSNIDVDLFDVAVDLINIAVDLFGVAVDLFDVTVDLLDVVKSLKQCNQF
jgi:hypothetical protein